MALVVCAGPVTDWGAAAEPAATDARSIGRVVFTQIPVRAPGGLGDRQGQTRLGTDQDRLGTSRLAGQGAQRSPTPGLRGPGLPEGSRIVACDPARPGDGVTHLTGDFAAAGRPDVSFDGQRILFIARRAEADPLNVWEMHVDGSGVRQITNQARDCVEAIYLSTLYTMDAEEPVYQIAFCAVDADGTAAMYTCRLDGTRVRRITFSPTGATHPCQLSDGRLLFREGDRPVGARSGAPRPSMFTVHTDGTDVSLFAPAREDAAIRGKPCETPDGWIVYVVSAADDDDAGGSLIAVSRKRSLHTRRVVAADPNGRYASPSAMADGRLLASYRPRRDGSYGVYVVDPNSGRRSAKVFDAPQWHEVDAARVCPRPVPAGRSSVVDDRVDYGFLYCLNAYLSDTDPAKAIRPGQIKRVRITKAHPPMNQHEPVTEEVLGEVPVETDGSIYLAVPARTPLRLETLGEDGGVLQGMRSWIWVMPKEGRGCIGCHEDRERTPPNRFVRAVRKEPREVGVVVPRRTRSGVRGHPRRGYGGSSEP